MNKIKYNGILIHSRFTHILHLSDSNAFLILFSDRFRVFNLSIHWLEKLTSEIPNILSFSVNVQNMAGMDLPLPSPPTLHNYQLKIYTSDTPTAHSPGALELAPLGSFKYPPIAYQPMKKGLIHHLQSIQVRFNLP